MPGVGPDVLEGGSTGGRDNTLLGSTAGALRMVGGQPSAVAVEVVMEDWLLSVLVAAVFVAVVEMVDRFVADRTVGAAALTAALDVALVAVIVAELAAGEGRKIVASEVEVYL